ncbi:hypothetical protein [Actinomadura sp. 21ATH]|uniref:hypothetical protein n=1 Tax=Actinomadura sp. 21ATH TaxID=1735444 RepID=UPI0035BF3671
MPLPPRPPLAAVLATALLGLTAIAGGGFAIVHDLIREPTEAELLAARRTEAATRWRALNAGEIFPPRVDRRGQFSAPGQLLHTASRVGIAPEAPCRDAFDAPVAAILDRHGCRTALRATYVDGSRTLVTTVSVVAMPDPARAAKADGELSREIGVRGGKKTRGVRAVPFKGTLAASFDDSRRSDFWYSGNGTTYLFFRSSGWLTDRGSPAKYGTVESFDFAGYVTQALIKTFGSTTDVCEERGVRC